MEAVLDSTSTPSVLERTAADVTGVVLSNEPAATGYKHLRLSAPPPAPDVRAGQFFQLECPATPTAKPFFRRPMSIYRADPAEGVVEFLYKVTGAGTAGLATLRPGDTMRLLGPLGIGFSIEPASRSIVVVGRGVGLATLAPLAELAASQGANVTAVLSARSAEHIMSVDRFDAIGASIHTVLDSDGTSAPENVERILLDLIAGKRADAFYTCGSNRLMLLLQRLGREYAIQGEVALEQQMACGLGMCFCCVRNFRKSDASIVSRRVCWDGPVFDLQEAISW